MNHKIKYKDKISLKQAINKIVAYGMFGIIPPLKTPLEVAKYLKEKGVDPNQLAEKCRNYKEKIPFFENLCSTTFQVVTLTKHPNTINKKGGGSVALIDKFTGETKLEVKGNGQLSFSPYQSKFEKARKYLMLSVDNGDFEDFLTAITAGISSIESYLNYRAKIWNRKNPDDQLIDDKQHKISLNNKIDIWIPKMIGSKIKKDNKIWFQFQELRNIRDQLDQHNHDDPIGCTYEDLCEQINKFRLGISQFLANLHVLFREKVPACIINAIYMPDVEIIN